MIRSFLTIVAVVAFNSLSFGQIMYFHFPYIPLPGEASYNFFSLNSWRLEAKEITDKRKKLHIQQIDYTVKTKKGKIEKSTAVFNTSGFLTSYVEKDTKHIITYKNDTLLIEYNKEAKKAVKSVFAYENNLFVNSKKWEGDKLVSEINLTHDSKGNQTSQSYKFGRKLKKSTECKSFYDNSGKIEKWQWFKNNKLKSEYIYGCKEEGELVKNDKIEQASVCNWKEEKNDGTYYTFSRVVKNDENYLYKTTFSKDSIFIMSEQFLNDSILIDSYQKNENITLEKHFKKNGKLQRSSISIKNSNNQTIETHTIFYGHKNRVLDYYYEFDSKGNQIKSTHFQNGKMFQQVEFEYHYY